MMQQYLYIAAFFCGLSAVNEPIKLFKGVIPENLK
jgi:hypothetical protein